ncbi:hypothetical protein GGR56DRAFT_230644 [Xylariaceae sp. FL0804]|nr:hypothetical protein GGR56DRAFT_230644 [Xylariaceae sp. FL0804]
MGALRRGLGPVRYADDSFASRHHEARRVRVFIGATSGIGFGTLRRMVTMLPNSIFYLLGQSAARSKRSSMNSRHWRIRQRSCSSTSKGL